MPPLGPQTALTVLLTIAVIATKVTTKTIDQIIAAAASKEFEVISSDKENGDAKVEMDMIFTPTQWNDLQRLRSSPGKKRNAISLEKYRWNTKVIPYEIDSSFDSSDREQVQQAFNDWNTYTCLSFRPASEESERIVLEDGEGCLSYVGRTGRNRQKITLAKDCRTKVVILHELGHALGFFHEQSRPDSNEYIIIVARNILPSMLHNFDRLSELQVNTYGVPYDYRSIMHYGSTAFSISGEVTIITKQREYQDVIGYSEGLSFYDIKLANLMYKCGESCGNVMCPKEGFIDKDCKCYCPGNPVTLCTGDETTTAKVTTDNCTDWHSKCPEWARTGVCSKHLLYGKKYCGKSCKFCSGT